MITSFHVTASFTRGRKGAIRKPSGEDRGVFVKACRTFRTPIFEAPSPSSLALFRATIVCVWRHRAGLLCRRKSREPEECPGQVPMLHGLLWVLALGYLVIAGGARGPCVLIWKPQEVRAWALREAGVLTLELQESLGRLDGRSLAGMTHDKLQALGIRYGLAWCVEGWDAATFSVAKLCVVLELGSDGLAPPLLVGSEYGAQERVLEGVGRLLKECESQCSVQTWTTAQVQVRAIGFTTHIRLSPRGLIASLAGTPARQPPTLTVPCPAACKGVG
jgi:hypothetical protein